MPGAGLTTDAGGQARPDRLALKPYWGKPAVRNFRGDDGNVGIIRSPVRAIALPDRSRPRSSPTSMREPAWTWASDHGSGVRSQIPSRHRRVRVRRVDTWT